MRAADDLLSNYQHVIDELSFITGDKGVFDVVVNDELIYSKAATGRHADDGEVLDLFRTVVGDGVPVYGS